MAANVRKCKAKGLSPSTVIVLLGVYWLAATKPPPRATFDSLAKLGLPNS